jgi:hypothetical protein
VSCRMGGQQAPSANNYTMGAPPCSSEALLTPDCAVPLRRPRRSELSAALQQSLAATELRDMHISWTHTHTRSLTYTLSADCPHSSACALSRDCYTMSPGSDTRDPVSLPTSSPNSRSSDRKDDNMTLCLTASSTVSGKRLYTCHQCMFNPCLFYIRSGAPHHTVAGKSPACKTTPSAHRHALLRSMRGSCRIAISTAVRSHRRTTFGACPHSATAFLQALPSLVPLLPPRRPRGTISEPNDLSKSLHADGELVPHLLHDSCSPEVGLEQF